MAVKGNSYKKHLEYQSYFSRRYASWANNHRGWQKMKKHNSRVLRKRLKREASHQDDFYLDNEEAC